MPQFTPPQSQLSPLIGQLISDRLRQQQLERQNNARIAQQQTLWQQKLAMEGIDPNSDMGAVANIMAERQALQKEGAESTLKGQRLAQQETELRPLATAISNLDPVRAGESRDVSQLRSSTQAGLLPYANQPDQLNRLSALIAERRGEEKQVIAGESRIEARTKRQEGRGEVILKDRQFHAAGVNLLSESHLGGGDENRDEVRRGFIDRWGVPDGIDRFVEADFEARAVALEEMRSKKTLAGRSEFALEAESHMFLNPGLSEDGAQALATKTGAIDTFAQYMTGEPIVVPLQGIPGKDFQKGRQALISIYEMFGMAEASFGRLAENPELVGELIGLEDAQTFLRAFGAENPEAAYYASLRNKIVSTMLKAEQGSRPSDYDLRFFMQLMPGLTEVGAGSAEARFNGMREILRIQADAQTDPSTRKKLEALRSKPWTKSDYDMKQAAENYQKKLDSLDPADTKGRVSAERAFDKAVGRWKKQRGSEFVPEANGLKAVPGTAAPVEDPDLKAFEESGGFGN